MTQLESEISLILSQAQPVRYQHQFGVPEAVALVAARDAGWVHEGAPGIYRRKSREVDLLVRLYAQQTEEARALFPMFVLARFAGKTSDVIVHALVETRQIARLSSLDLHPLDQKTATLRDRGRLIAQALLDSLRAKLAIEPHAFSPTDLEQLEILARNAQHEVMSSPKEQSPLGQVLVIRKEYRNLLESVNTLRKTVTRAKYLQLAARIETGENPAIDRDRQVLEDRLASLALSPVLQAALSRATSLGERSVDPFDFKQAMEWLRTFFEQLAQALSTRVAQHRGEQFESYDGRSFNPAKQFLRSVGVINDNDQLLLQAIYNYLSREGTHSLGSEREQFYAMKVTVIEWALVLTNRVQSLMAAES